MICHHVTFFIFPTNLQKPLKSRQNYCRCQPKSAVTCDWPIIQNCTVVWYLYPHTATVPNSYIPTHTLTMGYCMYNFDQLVTLARFSKNLSLRSMIRQIWGQTLFFDPSVMCDWLIDWHCTVTVVVVTPLKLLGDSLLRCFKITVLVQYLSQPVMLQMTFFDVGCVPQSCWSYQTTLSGLAWAGFSGLGLSKSWARPELRVCQSPRPGSAQAWACLQCFA